MWYFSDHHGSYNQKVYIPLYVHKLCVSGDSFQVCFLQVHKKEQVMVTKVIAEGPEDLVYQKETAREKSGDL